MELIVQSVGDKGKNNFKDVSIVQSLLNGCLHLLTPLRPLEPDGNAGLKTIFAIKEFQRRVANINNPDGRVDPSGKTLELLNQKSITVKKPARDEVTANNSAATGFKFPLKTRSPSSYKTGMRRFGSNRKGGRAHGGCDLYAPVGTPVYAMDDGEVIQDLYAFYLGTYALEIKHTQFVARYGELRGAAPNIKKGAKIKKGQLIGYIGELKGLNMSMLHLELYSGKATGALTVRGSKPYQRRADLIDPTAILDKAQ